MIRYTKHAMDRIREWRLDRAWVERAVAQPDRAIPDPRRLAVTLSFKAVPERGGRILRVAHRPDGSDVLVLTAHFDRGAKL
jgi:Domain of unknown function (DUF4258)